MILKGGNFYIYLTLSNYNQIKKNPNIIILKGGNFYIYLTLSNYNRVR